MIIAITKLRVKEMGLKKASNLYKVPVTILKRYVQAKEIQCLECEGWAHVKCTDSERDACVHDFCRDK